MFVGAPIFSINNSKFNVIILAAGAGTRLRPETDFIPKALVQLGEARAIDCLINCFRHVSGRLIVAASTCADLLVNYVKGRHAHLETMFSVEPVSELRGAGTSLLYALDYSSSRLPTIVSFCDYVLNAPISVDNDGIVVYRPGSSDGVIGTYATVAQVDEGVVHDLVNNPNIAEHKENGFTGILVAHDTLTLKAIAFEAASRKSPMQLDYAFDIVRPYINRVRTAAIPISNLLEFGTEETLSLTRSRIHGDH